MPDRDNGTDDSATAKVLRGVVAGVIAGATASLMMDRFQAIVSALFSLDESGEPTTQKAADAIASAVIGVPVPKEHKPLAGQTVHYALGIGLGVVYAIAAEFRPAVTAGYGTAFGIGAATLLDETAVPAVGLGEAPWQTDISTTLYGYASHLVFGVVAEVVRRQVRMIPLA